MPPTGPVKYVSRLGTNSFKSYWSVAYTAPPSGSDLSAEASWGLNVWQTDLCFGCRGSAIARIIGNNALSLQCFATTVKMWVYEENINGRKLTDIINTEHENIKYLPGYKLPENVVRERRVTVYHCTQQNFEAVLGHTVRGGPLCSNGNKKQVHLI